MTITVSTPQIAAVLGEVDAVDFMALKLRAAVYAEQGAVDGEAEAATTKSDFEADKALVDAAVAAIAEADGFRIAAIKGYNPADSYNAFADAGAQQTAIDGYVADLAAAEAALPAIAGDRVAAGQAEAVATNTAWYGNGGVPELADVSG